MKHVRTHSLRCALNDIRDNLARAAGLEGFDVGHHSGTVQLQDGTVLDVGLAAASDGGHLMGVYQIKATKPNGQTSYHYGYSPANDARVSP